MRSVFLLAFDRTACDAFHIISLHTHKQGDDDTAYHKRACAEYGEVVVETVLFRVYHFIQSQRYGVFLSIADDGIDENEIAPR